jgi:DNA-directed RNA polymerase specialized sigma24 family protein
MTGVSSWSRIGLEADLAAREQTAVEYLRREQATAVRIALAALSPEQRHVLELAHYGGWTHSEIAEHFDIPLRPVTPRSAFHRCATPSARSSHPSPQAAPPSRRWRP